MLLAKIIGTVVATRKDPRLVSSKLMVARSIDPRGKPEGNYLVAVDTVDAGVGETVAGVYRQRVNLSSGRFAMIDDGLGFSLVPWSPSLERHLGRHVSGIAEAGRIEWNFGRRRGLSI